MRAANSHQPRSRGRRSAPSFTEGNQHRLTSSAFHEGKSLSREASLCLQCGLCCNGVLFRDVELQPGDRAARLKALGLPLKTARGKVRLPQPCAALDGCRCCVYAQRPSRCREFDCALLLAVREGRISSVAAQRVILKTHRLLTRVEECLAQLGEAKGSHPLALRFRRMAKRFEDGTGDAEMAERFGRLTIAWHELNLQLHARFLCGVAG